MTHQGEKWKWTTEEEKSFNAPNKALSEDATLGYFKTGLPTKLAVDAGPKGLGLILFQKRGNNWKPVLYACKAQQLSNGTRN